MTGKKHEDSPGHQNIAPEYMHVYRHPRWKRALDVAGAGFLLVVTFPLLVFGWMIIRFGSTGPILFRQTRIGVCGRPFRIWKLRTMKVDTDQSRHLEYVRELCRSNQPLQKLDVRNQLIPGGALLRDLGIDELPQLVNVLFGDMSLVGPRPDVVPLHDYAPENRKRFRVLPGITGLWQVSGKNETTFEEMVRLDEDYVERQSVLLDLKILFSTPYRVLEPIFYSHSQSNGRRLRFFAWMHKSGSAAKV